MTPDQEGQLLNETARGAKATQLLSSATYQEAMQKVEAGIVDAWKASPIRDEEGQKYLRLMLKCLHDLQGHIRDVAETGKLAAVQLERERTLAQKAQDAVKGVFRRAA